MTKPVPVVVVVVVAVAAVVLLLVPARVFAAGAGVSSTVHVPDARLDAVHAGDHSASSCHL